MAAAPSQPSPDQASESKKPSSADNTATAAAAPLPEQQAPLKNNVPENIQATEISNEELTYAGTKSSDAFKVSKQLLDTGEFEKAMEAIGSAMTVKLSKLPEETASVHESMGPLYYLYGTTLLYSLEESTDGLQGSSSSENEEADDAQIAWENLEAARHILATMLRKPEHQHNEELRLDLAQTHLRLGDLERSNSQFLEAIDDYNKCLEIWVPALGLYNRKVANVYYSLAMVYISFAAEGDKKKLDEERGAAITPEQQKEYKNKALEFYLTAGKSFAGRIASLCGKDSETITSDPTNTEQEGKTSGMDASDLEINAKSCVLRAIRARVADLRSQSDQETVSELREILDEIQETIDEAGSVGKAMEEVSEMKAQAQAAAEGRTDVKNADGSSTTIGFQHSSAATASSSASNHAATTAQPNQTMMVVRKKNKRNASSQKSEQQEKKAKTGKH